MVRLSLECPIKKNIALLDNPNPNVRLNAVETLGRCMNKTAVQPLIDLLKTEKDIAVRRGIILSLALLGGDEVLPILLSALKEEKDLQTRINAAGGLRFFGDKINALDILVILLEEKDKQVKDVLTSTIIFLRDDSILSSCITNLKKQNEEQLQECLLEIIGSFTKPESKELLKKYTQPEFPEKLRLIATRAMGKHDDVKFIPILYDIYQNDACKEIRDLAYKILDELSIILGFSSIDQMVLDFIEKLKEK
ncbi:MAG: HEAT repeat domain-containing protein [Asgard group archaeon]|nr:HEAT repeat domain-containing protein [Asgard group archaeon]